MKILITESQLYKIINELYSEDEYLKGNDIFDYEPTQKEIDDFNKRDINKSVDFRGFGDVEGMDRIRDLNKNFSKPIKNKPDADRVKLKYTGMAKIVYAYPNGRQVDVPNTYLPTKIVHSKLNKIKQSGASDSDRYSVKYEIE